MSGTDNFHTYTGSYLNGLGRATIIITVDTDAVPLAYSEYFAFLESDDLLYDQFRIECDVSDVINTIAHIYLSRIIDDSLFKAEQRLSRELRDRYKNYLPDNSLSKLIDLSLSDEIAIVRLIMRNRFNDKIDQVIQITKSEKLRKFLNTHKTLPKLAYYSRL